MSKATLVRKAAPQPAVLDTKDTFVTYGGEFTIKLHPVSPFLIDDTKSLVFIPEVPQIEVPNVAGDVQTMPLDEEWVKTAPELKPLWDSYVADMAKAEQDARMQLLSLCIREGADIEVDQVWVDRQMKVGYKIPEDPDALKVYYALRAVLKRPSDMSAFMEQVLTLSELTEERLAVVERSFQHPVEVPNGQDTEGADSTT